MFKRKSIRLKNYDYSTPGMYYITICTSNRINIFGNVVDGEMVLNEYGKIARDEWLKTCIIRDQITINEFVIMPNHMHGIIIINDDYRNCRGTARRAPTDYQKFGKPIPNSIPTIIRSYKSAVTNKINMLHNTPGQKIWQRNYYERIIRNEYSLQKIRDYIHYNPSNWQNDFNNNQYVK